MSARIEPLASQLILLKGKEVLDRRITRSTTTEQALAAARSRGEVLLLRLEIPIHFGDTARGEIADLSEEIHALPEEHQEILFRLASTVSSWSWLSGFRKDR